MLIQHLHVARDGKVAPGISWRTSPSPFTLHLMADEHPTFVYMALALAGLRVLEPLSTSPVERVTLRGFRLSPRLRGTAYWLHDYMPVVLGGQPFVFLDNRFCSPDLKDGR